MKVHHDSIRFRIHPYDKPKITQRLADDLVIDYCYDRDMCRCLGIDYCDIRDADVSKIKHYIATHYEIVDDEVRGTQKMRGT